MLRVHAGPVSIPTRPMRIPLLIVSLALVVPALARDLTIFSREKLAAWCIVPFDAKKRGPVERAEMLNRLGITRFAYDWRDEQIPTFDAEVEAMKAQGIEISAWWMSRGPNEVNRKIFEVIGRHGIHPQLWVLIDEPLKGNADQQAKVKAAAAEIRPLTEEAKRLGCQVGLYNHGGWFGEPVNQIAIIKELDLPNVGIVYNFHHGHAHIDGFPALLAEMKPYLIALNLNGMVKDGESTGRKILTIGEGDQEQAMIAAVADSGWKGPVGILNHRADQDAEIILKANRDGLGVVVEKLK